MTPGCNDVIRLLETKDLSAAYEKWKSMCNTLLYRKADFLVPTWWYLSDVHECNELAQHDMIMPGYPDDRGQTPQCSLDPWGEVSAESADPRTLLLLQYVRGNHRAALDRLDEAIMAVCRTPRSGTEVSQLIGRTQHVVDQHLRRLTSQGALVRVGEEFHCPDDVQGDTATT